MNIDKAFELLNIKRDADIALKTMLYKSYRDMQSALWLLIIESNEESKMWFLYEPFHIKFSFNLRVCTTSSILQRLIDFTYKGFEFDHIRNNKVYYVKSVIKHE